MASQAGTKKETQPKHCTKCNDFFGSAQFNGLCSGCYTKIHGKPKKAEQKIQPAKKVQDTKQKYQGTKKGEQADKTKCYNCNKKIGLLGTECKCSYVFCNVHRMPQDHACTYNYEAEGKDHLKKEIKKLQHEKVGKLDSL